MYSLNMYYYYQNLLRRKNLRYVTKHLTNASPNIYRISMSPKIVMNRLIDFGFFSFSQFWVIFKVSQHQLVSSTLKNRQKWPEIGGSGKMNLLNLRSSHYSMELSRTEKPNSVNCSITSLLL